MTTQPINFVNDHASLLNSYFRNGVIGPFDVISIEEATTFYNDFFTNHDIFPLTNKNDQLNKEQPYQPKQYSQNNNNLFKTHLFVPWVNSIIRHPQLIRIVQNVLQSNDIRCWSCDFNIRYYNTNTIIAPHQDATYANLTPSEEVITVWVALSDPVTLQHGGLIFYKGSHLLGQLLHICDDDYDETKNDNEIDETIQIASNNELLQNKKGKLQNILSRGQRCTIPNCNETPAISIPLRGGQATIHHFYTIHGSGQNIHSQQPRVGLAIRYMTANVRKRQQHYKVKEMITWISGCTDIIHNDCFEWEPILPNSPTIDDITRGKAAHAVAMERETTNYFS
jgi:chlorinating enzyme